MNLKILWPFSRKNTVADGNADLVRHVFGGAVSKTGLAVSPATVMQVSAAYACIRNISEDMAKLPLHLYKRLPRGKERASAHPLYALLNTAPNDWQTSFEFVEMLTAHMLLRGNGYARIVRGFGGKVLELLPLHPDRMTVKQLDDLSLSYKYRTARGGTVTLDPADVFHLRGLSLDGVVGVSPLTYARESFGLALAAEEHGARQFAGRAVGPGVFKSTRKLTEQGRENLSRSFAEKGGLGNSNAPLILEDGLEWVSLGIKPADLQYIETRKFQVEEIARLYRMPMHKIGQLDKATFSNIEHQSQEYVSDTLLPWARRWEQAIGRDLLSVPERRDHYAAFLFNNLLRGDSKSRSEFYRGLFNTGALSPNDILEMEDRDTFEGGDMRFVPMNMVPVDMAREFAARAGNKGGDSADPAANQVR
ncbi:phage portal protein [Laribacter hongkongensis]|uniref:phage portal protein n=1 Tax=Laribacter hongkongensis TaxID=168471 RepID=UPI001EFD9446|nr:phage portal protein [Laribacter hongkongensis]MCG9094450.1 phage portal protein [Laribacter hongkongensis]